MNTKINIGNKKKINKHRICFKIIILLYVCSKGSVWEIKYIFMCLP